jgi:hypothetical protein
MISTAIETLLALIEALLPEFGVASTNVISKIVEALVTIVPIVAADASNFLTPIKNIIAALQASGNVTDAQMKSLTDLDAQCDAAFEAAAKDVGV